MDWLRQEHLAILKQVLPEGASVLDIGCGTGEEPARIRVLEVLADGERSVGQMAPLVGIELSHLSQQLAVLRRARLVRTRKEGSTVYYDVGDPAVVGLLAAAKQVLINQLAGTEELLVGLRTEGRST